MNPEKTAARLGDMADRFGLTPEWDVKYTHDPELKRQAQTLYDDDYHSALISTGAAFPEDSRGQDQVLAHELSHLLLADLGIAARRGLDRLPKGERRIAQAGVDREEELLCDRLARLLTTK